MHVVRALNVNDAWPQLIELVHREGKWTETRAGRALVVPAPVATVYSRPTQRVLFDPVRDANPFFSLFEPLWMLAGRDDAPWLDRFVSDFSARFAEEGGRMHGAYGRRWRGWFERPGTGDSHERGDSYDQLDAVVDLLRDYPLDRQAVIQMWDPSADLGVKGLKDRPCNQQILLRADRVSPRFLDITVTNRSNDLSWGLITANACQFSTLHEYLAARMGYQVGTYTQFSNNLHLYEAAMLKAEYSSAAAWIQQTSYPNRYPDQRRLVDEPSNFDSELERFLSDPPSTDSANFDNGYFYFVARPMWLANEARLAKDWSGALRWAASVQAADWREAALAWLRRREPS